MNLRQKIGLIAGTTAFAVILLFGNFDPQNPQVTKMAAAAALMAIWWITEPVPLPATSLIPLILYPFMGIQDGEETASVYMNSIIFLFLGGFLLAIAMERWGLHKRIALKIITLFGGSPDSIVLAFIVSTALISMWISNTATALMMLPIGLAIINKMENEFDYERTKNFSTSVMIGIAYASSIGGMATLIGTPANLAFIRIYGIIFPDAERISFGSWMLMAVPISILLLIVTALMLKIYFKTDKTVFLSREEIKEEYNKLGKISFEEKIVAAVFGITVFLWVFRADLNLEIFTIPGWSNLLHTPDYLNDGVVAITMALILFFIPSKNQERKNILDAASFGKVPWGIILLFGGGFALAEGFTRSGLSQFIASGMEGLTEISPILIIFIIAFLVTFLSEFTSNTATAQMILPVMASVGVAAGINPLLLMISAALSASLGFMMPVATPPNTIVFSSNKVRITDMAKAGFTLNIAGIIAVSILVYLLGSVLFNLNEFPWWAKIKP